MFIGKKNMNRHLAKTVIISGLGAVLSYIIYFIITPIIINSVGIEAYGFVTLAKSFTNYAGIIATALTVFIVRYISINYHQGALDEANSYYSSSIAACLLFTLSILLLSSLLIFYLERLILIPDELITSVKVLFLIAFLTFCLTTITTPFSSAAIIKDRLDVIGLIKIAACVFEAGVLIVLFRVLVPSVWIVGIASLTSALIVLIGNLLITKKLTPELKLKKQLISKERISNLIKNGTWSAINQLGNTLNSGLDMWISNLLLSLIDTGQLSVAKTIGNMFATLSGVIYQPLQPRLIKCYANESKEQFVYELGKCMRISGFVGALAFSGFAVLGQLYLRLWLPQEDYFKLYLLSIITVANYITDFLMRPLYFVNTLTVKNKIPCWITVFGGLLNVFSMFLLIKFTDLGVYSVVITTAVIMISINLFFNPNYAAHCLGVSPKPFYIITAKHLAACTAMTICFFLMNKVLNPNGWIGLVLSAAGMTLAGGVLYIIIVCNAAEKKSIYQMLRKHCGFS